MLKKLLAGFSIVLFLPGILFAQELTLSENPQVNDLVNQAALARSNNNVDQAIAFYNQAIQIDPKNFTLYRNVGVLFFEKNDYLNSAKALLTANKLKPDDVFTMIYTGKVLLKIDDPQTARTYLETALKQDANNPDLYAALGDMHRQLQEYPQALEAYQRTIELGPQKPEGYTGLGHLYYKDKRYEQAANSFEEALKHSPESGDLWYNTGMSYLGMNNLNKAAECMHRSLSYQPNNPETFNALGVIFTKARQFDLAEKSFQKALQLDPNYQEAKKNLDDLKWQQRQAQFSDSSWSRSPYEVTSQRTGPVNAMIAQRQRDNLSSPFNTYGSRRSNYPSDPFASRIPNAFDDPYSNSGNSGTASDALMAIGQALLAGMFNKKSDS